MYYVYVLFSYKDKKLYTGFSSDLRKRVKEHTNGEVLSTKSRLPTELIYYEAYRDKRDAIKREIFLKSGRGREVLKSLLIHSLQVETT
jgi:putative endonuclease